MKNSKYELKQINIHCNMFNLLYHTTQVTLEYIYHGTYKPQYSRVLE